MKILAMILITLVTAEFALHIIYHAVTGKAGLYDPAFAYLQDIKRWLKREINNGNDR